MYTNQYWLGSEASFREAEANLAKVQAHQAAHPGEDEKEEETPYLNIVDGVGIVTVQGSLYDGTFGRIGQWFGVTGYGDIQNALVKAVSSPDVQSILMVYKSGGGAVSGVNETAALIMNVDKIKPVFAYTPSTMASAALWLGLAARKVYASNTAVVGSIGVLSMVVSYHRQLKEEGIDAVVIRSGKYKALGHGADPMSDLAVESAQAQIDYMGTLFLEYAAERRGMAASAADTRFGQGRTFVGEQAKAVGLIDDVVGYSQAFQNAKASVPPDNKPKLFAAAGPRADAGADMADNLPEPKGQSSMPKLNHIPSADELLAMANGVDLTEGEDKPAATAPATGEPAADAPEADAPEADTEVAATLAQTQKDLAETALKLSAAQTELDSLKAQLADAATAKAAADTVTASLANIVRASVKSMSLPLNKPTDTLAEATPEQLVAAHTEVVALFKAKIKVGGAAAPSKQTEAEKSSATAINPMFAAAAHLNKQRKGL